MKSRPIEISKSKEYLILRAVKDFFNPHEQWGRLNKRQFITGILCTTVYFLVNTFLNRNIADINTLTYSSGGLIFAICTCGVILVFEIIRSAFILTSRTPPWAERYMPVIITLLGLFTLSAIQNLGTIGMQDAAIWVNVVILFIVFIITAGYFVENNSNERTIKRWFALLGYYFSVVVFFYFCETIIFNM